MDFQIIVFSIIVLIYAETRAEVTDDCESKAEASVSLDLAIHLLQKVKHYHNQDQSNKTISEIHYKPSVRISMDGEYFSPGNKYNITCEAKGYPATNISWSWKPFCLNGSHECNESNAWTTFGKYYEVNKSIVRTDTDRIRSISYLSVVGEESGFYKCKAQNEMGDTEIEKLFVVSDAENGFEITYEPKSSKENTQSVALCKASLVRYSHLQWKRISLLTNESRLVSDAKQDISQTPFSLQTMLMESHDEKYVCFATPRITGEVQEKPLPPDIQDPAVYLNISGTYIDVKVNETMYIKCSGSPPLRWDYKHPMGSPVIPSRDHQGSPGFTKDVFDSENESIIRIKFDHQEATGRYICKNDFSEASVHIFVNGDRLILSEPHLFIYDEYIPCIPTASGVNMTLWKTFETNSSLEQVPLEFDPTRGFIAKSDPDYFNGLFECAAEFEGKKESHEMVLDVLSETTTIPTVSINSSNATYVMAGSSFSLTCVVQTDAFAHVEIKWSYPNEGNVRKNIKEEHSRDETHLYMNSTLSILKAKDESSSGTYLCKAVDHSKRSNSAQVNVTIYETAPATVLTFLGESEEVIANKNGKVELVATYKVFPPASNVQARWSKDGEPIISKFKHNEQRQTPGLLSLEIADLNGNDSGTYTVTANATGNIEKKSFLLLVRDTDAHPIDCVDVLRNGENKSGIYTIWPRSSITRSPIEVYCDMDTDGGGWTVFQRRGDFGRPKDFFFQDWKNYKTGFGDIDKDFWLGNDNIFALSNQRDYSLRIDLRDVEGKKAYALYDTFWLDDEYHNYTLHIDGYSGDAGDSMIQTHNGQKFSTKDRINHVTTGKQNCAEKYKGAWWYNACLDSNLNGIYHKGKHDSGGEGVGWRSFKGLYDSLEWTEMKIRSREFSI